MPIGQEILWTQLSNYPNLNVTKEKNKVRVSLELSHELLLAIDDLKGQLGLQKRSEVVERVLHEVFFGDKQDQ